MEGTVTIPLDDYMVLREKSRAAEYWNMLRLPDPSKIRFETVNVSEHDNRATFAHKMQITFTVEKE